MGKRSLKIMRMKDYKPGSREILPGPEALFLCGMDSVSAKEPLLILAENAGFGRPRLVFCTASMIGKPLSEALNASNGEQPLDPEKLPPVCLFSGLEPAPIKEFLENFHTTGLPRPIFATATGSNLNMTVRDLVLHLLEERKARTGR